MIVNKKDDTGVSLLFLIAACGIISMLSGCGLLVKKVDAWGLVVEFPQGFDANIGANSIDHVDDRKGLGIASTNSDIIR